MIGPFYYWRLEDLGAVSSPLTLESVVQIALNGSTDCSALALALKQRLPEQRPTCGVGLFIIINFKVATQMLAWGMRGSRSHSKGNMVPCYIRFSQKAH